MARLTLSTTTDAAGAALLSAPRDDVVLEQETEPGHLIAADGPFRSYERTVTVTPSADGKVRVDQQTEFRLAIPVWGVLFTPLVKRALRQRRDDGSTPWWAPPDRLNARQATVLGLLCTFTVISGYLGTVITQTITYAADEFDASRSAQGAVLAAVRVGVLVSLAVVALADRRGRRRMLLLAAAAGCVFTVTGAAVPGLAWLGVSQTAARSMSTALGLLITIVSVEEMPRSSRAYAISVMALTAALGAGMAVWFLPLADLGVRAWRILYVLPVLALPVIAWAAKQLPETHRFEASVERPHEHAHRSRLVLIAASAFLTTMFLAPASQFQNEFLRTERGFSALLITVFTIGTNTPGSIGILVGGHLADTRGRRGVGAVALAGGVAFTVAMYLVGGPSIWLFSILGSIIGAAAIPALGVYGPELFPTSARGRTNGIIATVGVIGSGLGLLVAGSLADSLGGLGPAISILAVGPLILCVLVITKYPETAHLELEDINPEDRA
jgi:MFS family permease